MSASPAPGRRIVYFGTPEVAVAPLEALWRAGHDIALVVTGSPKRRGRRQPPTPTPVAAAAADLGLPTTFDLSDAEEIDADLGVVVAYGELIADAVLERRRTVNLHFSMLPRWRGAAPVERAILAGDTESGVCLMEVASEIDTGGVYRRASTSIGAQESADELRARLCELGIELLLGAVTEGFGTPSPQSGAVTWADKISSADLRIDWATPADRILRIVRVGGAWTTFRGRRLKVLEARPHVDGPSNSVPDVGGPDGGEGTDVFSGPRAAGGELAAPGTISVRASRDGPDAVLVATATDALQLVTVQVEGRGATAAQDWRNGARIASGERFDG